MNGMDALTRLFTSTADLYARFGLDADSVPPDKRRKLLMEEVGELVAASALVVYYDDTGVAIEDVCDEAADVLVTTLGLLQAHGITLDELVAACERVAQKNDEKRAANGWGMVGGKIRRVE